MKIEINQVASDLWEVLKDGEFIGAAETEEEAEQLAAAAETTSPQQ
jgi:hypothetical protein